LLVAHVGLRQEIPNIRGGLTLISQIGQNWNREFRLVTCDVAQSEIEVYCVLVVHVALRRDKVRDSFQKTALPRQIRPDAHLHFRFRRSAIWRLSLLGPDVQVQPGTSSGSQQDDQICCAESDAGYELLSPIPWAATAKTCHSVPQRDLTRILHLIL